MDQKSHYARTQCLGAEPNSLYMHSLHADFSECTVTKLAVHSILKSYAYLVVTNFERRAENGNFLLLFVCIMLQAPAVRTYRYLKGVAPIAKQNMNTNYIPKKRR